jgi:hypothetical protein
MGREKKPTGKSTAGSEAEGAQPIGHITTPIEDKDLERAKVIFTRHAVHMEKIRTPDNWWTLFLPDGTTKTKTGMRDKATIYTVQLPDGYCFLYRAPVFYRDKSYGSLPMITVLEKQEE